MSDNWKVFWVVIITLLLIGGLGGFMYKVKSSNTIRNEVYENNIVDNSELREDITNTENSIENTLNMNVQVYNDKKK